MSAADYQHDSPQVIGIQAERKAERDNHQDPVQAYFALAGAAWDDPESITTF